MAAITFTSAHVRPSFGDRAEIYSAIAGVAVDAGQAVFFDTTTGKLALSNGAVAGTAVFAGIATESAGADQVVSVLKRGHVGGYNLSSQSYGDTVFLNDTDGVIGDAAGAVSVSIGKVVPLTDGPTMTKVIYIEGVWS